MKAFLIITFISFSALVFANGHHTKHPMQEQLAQAQVPVDPTTPQFHSFRAMQPPQQTGDVTDRIVNIFLDQGVIGAMLILMFFWFYKQEQTASQERMRMNEKFEELIRESFD